MNKRQKTIIAGFLYKSEDLTSTEGVDYIVRILDEDRQYHSILYTK